MTSDNKSIDNWFDGPVMGKIEGQGDQWHGHVTALSVAPQYRRLNLAAKLMSGLEMTSEKYSQP